MMTWSGVGLAVGILWLAALTLMVAALIRHVGALQLAVRAGSSLSSNETFDFDTDGPAPGSHFSSETTELMHQAGVEPDRTDDQVAVVLSATCMPCVDRAREIISAGNGLERTIFLVSGSNEQGLTQLRALFAQTAVRVVQDPLAHDIARSVDVKSTPFAFRFSASAVAAKAYLRSYDDFVGVTQAPSLPSLLEITPAQVNPSNRKVSA